MQSEIVRIDSMAPNARQLVPPSQGSEMLSIFKNYSLKTSILDDFQFYETRQKFMQDNRARKQTHLQHQPVIHRVNREQDQRPPQTIASSSTSQDAALNRSADTPEQGKSLVKSSETQENSVAQDVQTESSVGQPQTQEASQAETSLSSSKTLEKNLEK
ncbi:hypothetical protein L7F22_024601 [Adiantum nelumboides]|nr:hypothetical protein [Adiantum nelumboides]